MIFYPQIFYRLPSGSLFPCYNLGSVLGTGSFTIRKGSKMRKVTSLIVTTHSMIAIALEDRIHHPIREHTEGIDYLYPKPWGITVGQLRAAKAGDIFQNYYPVLPGDNFMDFIRNRAKEHRNMTKTSYQALRKIFHQNHIPDVFQERFISEYNVFVVTEKSAENVYGKIVTMAREYGIGQSYPFREYLGKHRPRTRSNVRCFRWQPKKEVDVSIDLPPKPSKHLAPSAG